MTREMGVSPLCDKGSYAFVSSERPALWLGDQTPSGTVIIGWTATMPFFQGLSLLKTTQADKTLLFFYQYSTCLNRKQKVLKFQRQPHLTQWATGHPWDTKVTSKKVQPPHCASGCHKKSSTTSCILKKWENFFMGEKESQYPTSWRIKGYCHTNRPVHLLKTNR